MNPPPHAPQAEPRLYILDFLRFFAALAVTIYHFGFHQWALDESSLVQYPEIAGVAMYGCLAVPLFFMISGFVIALSMQGKTAQEFALGRFLRLYPTFWVCLLITALGCTLWPTPGHEVSLHTLLANFTMMPHLLHQPYLDGPYWTLQVELRFYVLMLGLLLVKRSTWLVPYAAGWLGLSVLDWYREIHFLHVQLALDCAPFFCAGMVFSAIFRHGACWWHWGLLSVTYIMGCLRTIVNLEADIQGRGWRVSPWVIVPTLAVCFVAFYGIALRKISIGKRYAVVTALGGMTYPLYLLHNGLGNIVFNQVQDRLNRWLLLSLLLGGFLGLSYAIWRWIETPLLRKFRTRRKATVRLPETSPASVPLA